MQKKALCLFALTIYMFFSLPVLSCAAINPPGNIYSETALLMNLDTDTAVFEKNANQRMYPASLTKIVTAMLVLESGRDLDETITITKDAFEGLGYGYSNAGLRTGEQMTLRQLLYAVMLQSACEGANAAAYEISGSISVFVDQMNTRVKELGCEDTHFANPHGLHDDDHYSTAQDLAKIVKHCLTLPAFMEICTAARFSMPATNMNPARTFVTTNLMIDKANGGKYYNSSVRGIKTGYTPEAGRCLISTAPLDGYRYLAIVMKAPTTDSSGNATDTFYQFIDTNTLYSWAFENFRVKSLVNLKTPAGDVKVEMGVDKDMVLVYPAEDVTALVAKDTTPSNVLLIPNLPQSIEAPVKKGDKLGTATLMLEGREMGTVDLIAGESIERSQTLYYMQVVTTIVESSWFRYSVIGMFGLGALYVIITLVVNRKHKKKGPKTYRKL